MQIFLHRILAFRPGKPRSALLRIVLGLLGVAVLALLVVFGVFIGLGMLLFAAVRRLTSHRARSPAMDGVIDAEYTVVEKHSPSLGLR